MTYLWLNDVVLAVVFRSGDVRLLMRDVVDDVVVDEQHVGSPVGNACKAILVNGYIVISTDSGIVSCFSPSERAVVHSSQLPMPKGSEACPRLLQHMQQTELLVGLDDGAVMRMKLPEAVAKRPLDLSLLRVQPKDDDDGVGGGRVHIKSLAPPERVMAMSKEDASAELNRQQTLAGLSRQLQFDFATSTQTLAVVNAQALQRPRIGACTKSHSSATCTRACTCTCTRACTCTCACACACTCACACSH